MRNETYTRSQGDVSTTDMDREIISKVEGTIQGFAPGQEGELQT